MIPNPADQAILKMLKVNMGHKNGERVGIVCQQWGAHLPPETRPAFERSADLCQRMYEVILGALGKDKVFLYSYIPEEARSGVDVPLRYKSDWLAARSDTDILFLPTAFSLTHTDFRREFTAKGARIASMPTFTLDMFAEDGPMNTDYLALEQKCREIADALKDSSKGLVHIIGKGTSMVVEINKKLIHKSLGMLTKRGEWGNLPGAETYVVPVFKGERSNGYFTVPQGWGGPFALPEELTFYVEEGCFTAVEGKSAASKDYIRDHIAPLLFQKEGYNVLAELGFGANPQINAQSIQKFGWSALLAEKIGDSVHFANGNSKGMGGENDVPVHIDWVVPEVKICYNYR